ncbi:MAG: hypothetical protein WAN65_19145, partial [Candidatus Sulfotelmatobacter sp.]
MDTDVKSDQGADDRRDAKLPALKAVYVMNVGFQRVEDGRYELDLPVIEMLAEADAPLVFRIDETFGQEGVKRRLDTVSLLFGPACHADRLLHLRPNFNAPNAVASAAPTATPPAVSPACFLWSHK